MPHVGLVPMLLTSQFNLVICNVSSQSPANLLLVWNNLPFALFNLSVSLVVVLTLISLVVSKEKLELLLPFFSFIKLLKFIFLDNGGRAFRVQMRLIQTDVVLKSVHVL